MSISRKDSPDSNEPNRFISERFVAWRKALLRAA
jgi:hypothetical protein